MGRYMRYVTFLLVVSLLTVLISNLVPGLYETVQGISKVAVINIHAPIAVSGSFFAAVTEPDTVIEQIETAENDPEIKVIILDINSPGGGPVASSEIAQKIEEVEKPVVAFIREIGASGAYQIAVASDYIIANRNSIVGSVGAVGSYIDFSGLMDEYNVTYNQHVSGRMKDMGSPYRAQTPEEKERMDKLVEDSFKIFADYVKNKRNFTEEQWEVIKTGTVFLGEESLEYNLIDEVGGRRELKEYLKAITNSKDIKYQVYEREKTLLDLLMSSKTDISLKYLPVNFIARFPEIR